MCLTNLVFQNRKKHIHMMYHFIWELISDETSNLKKVLHTNNRANMFTRVVTVKKLKLCMASANFLGTWRANFLGTWRRCRLQTDRKLHNSRMDGGRFVHQSPSGRLLIYANWYTFWPYSRYADQTLSPDEIHFQLCHWPRFCQSFLV